ncbi:MAG TPA: hypothetical protein VF808_13080 [Ktedonobacterales bacterium]
MRYLYVPLTRPEYTRLQELAWAERRSARDHAAVLLAQALGFGQIGAPATDHASPAPTLGHGDVRQVASRALT